MGNQLDRKQSIASDDLLSNYSNGTKFCNALPRPFLAIAGFSARTVAFEVELSSQRHKFCNSATPQYLKRNATHIGATPSSLFGNPKPPFFLAGRAFM